MVNQMCRACLEEDGSNDFGYLYSAELELFNLPEIIFHITGIKIDLTDGLPNYICQNCKTKLLEAYSFRTLYHESDNWLRSQINILASDSDERHIKAVDWDVELDTDLDYLEHLNEELPSANDIVRRESPNLNSANLAKSHNATILSTPDAENIIYNKDNEFNEKPDSTEEKSTTILVTKFKCSICGKKCSDEKSLKRHQHLHKQHKTKCPICPKQFSHKSNLKRHLTVHNGKKPLTCDKCDKSFTQPGDLYDHIKNHRQSTIDDCVLECEHCGEKTESYAAFYNHMKIIHSITENIKAFQCRVCKIRFVSKQGMYRHIDNIHENNRQNLRNRNKNFLCNTCGKSFHTNFHLHVHVRSHTGERPFQCQHCDKAFSQMSGLKMHTFTHTGERPFKCKICAKSFNQYGHVREHMLTHSDTRPHVCNICNHSFRVKGNLTAHMMIHMGKKPHVCEYCGKRFLQGTKLRQHTAKNHAAEIS